MVKKNLIVCRKIVFGHMGHGWWVATGHIEHLLGPSYTLLAKKNTHTTVSCSNELLSICNLSIYIYITWLFRYQIFLFFFNRWVPISQRNTNLITSKFCNKCAFFYLDRGRKKKQGRISSKCYVSCKERKRSRSKLLEITPDRTKKIICYLENVSLNLLFVLAVE